MQTSWIHPEDPAWTEALEPLRYDFYHLPSYSRMAAPYEGGEPIAFVAREGEKVAFIPLVRRELPEHLRSDDFPYDFTTVYGYPGPLTNAPDSPFFAEALKRFRDELKEQGALSAFIRMHPILSPEPALFDVAGKVVVHGPTLSMNLAQGEDASWSDVRQTTRHEIRKCKELGYVADIGNSAEYYDAFHDIYTETMARISAGKYYFFPREYYTQLKEALGDRLNVCAVKLGDEIVSAGLFTEVNGIVQYHLSGTRTAHQKAYPNKLMLDHMRRWALERGNTHLHLGGGTGAQRDGLYKFKAGFTKQEHDFSTIRVVSDDDAYRALTERVMGAGNFGDRSGFFPEYRQTPPAAE